MLFELFLHNRNFGDDDNDDGGDVVGKNLKVSASFLYQVQHAAAQPQAACARPRCLLKNTCLFLFDFRVSNSFYFFFFPFSDIAQVNK